MNSNACLSLCGTYRYWLSRSWAPNVYSEKRVLWTMLNPSTADMTQDDPTIRRCINLTKQFTVDGGGYNTLKVVNLFAYRATDPKVLLTVPSDDIIGPNNDQHINELAEWADLVVLAWGERHAKKPWHQKRVQDVLAILTRTRPNCSGEVHYLAKSKDGHPRHPLMLEGGLQPKLWKGKTS